GASQFWVLSKYFSERPNPSADQERRVEVTATHKLVMGHYLDFCEARVFQNLAYAVGVGECKWARNVRMMQRLRR
ncbi:MAG: hypothetical protein ACR2OV_01120, partial [Hyphomicrobiaceae bacterium]